jgi:hypothetical protein
MSGQRFGDRTIDNMNSGGLSIEVKGDLMAEGEVDAQPG